MHGHSTYHNICVFLFVLYFVIYQEPSIKLSIVAYLKMKSLKFVGLVWKVFKWQEPKGCLSEIGYVNGKVPQGSVLTLLLFLLYINDITDHIQILSWLFLIAIVFFILYRWNWAKIKLGYDKNLQLVHIWLVDLNPPKT
jgi:hypothetical protein